MPEIDPKDAATYAIVGKFVCSFTAAESYLRRFLRELVGVNDAVSRLLFDGVTNALVLDKIAALLPHSKLKDERLSRAKEICKQFNKINELRNDILHGHSFVHEDVLVTSDVYTAKRLKPGIPNAVIRHKDDLRGAIYDLDTIMLRLSLMMDLDSVQADEEPDTELWKSWSTQEILSISWQYRRAAQYQRKKTRGDTSG